MKPHHHSTPSSGWNLRNVLTKVTTVCRRDSRQSRTSLKTWIPARQWMAVGLFCGAAVVFPLLSQTVQPFTLPVRVNRWLEVREVVGTVNYYRGDRTEAATINQTRLEQVGDRLSTGAASRATLAVDTGIGFVTLEENTDLRIDELRTTASGGRVTRLNVTAGRARLRVRPFLDSESELEIRTPAGVSGVRGTQFGVGVTPSGQTGVLTEEGSVYAEAQGVTVSVDAGFQSLIVPGEPPTPPMPITDNVELDIIQLDTIDGGNAVQIVGRIDPLSQLVLDGVTQDIDSDGQFEVIVPRLGRDRIPATVSTLSGNEQDYELAVP